VPPLLIVDIRVVLRSGLSARASETSIIKNSGLDHVAEPFEQQQFGTAGVEGVNAVNTAVRDFHLSTLLLLNTS